MHLKILVLGLILAAVYVQVSELLILFLILCSWFARDRAKDSRALQQGECSSVDYQKQNDLGQLIFMKVVSQSIRIKKCSIILICDMARNSS